MATYFGANYGQFLMVVSFVMARILRSNKTDETWCELKVTFTCFLTGKLPWVTLPQSTVTVKKVPVIYLMSSAYHAIS